MAVRSRQVPPIRIAVIDREMGTHRAPRGRSTMGWVAASRLRVIDIHWTPACLRVTRLALLRSGVDGNRFGCPHSRGTTGSRRARPLWNCIGGFGIGPSGMLQDPGCRPPASDAGGASQSGDRSVTLHGDSRPVPPSSVGCADLGRRETLVRELDRVQIVRRFAHSWIHAVTLNHLASTPYEEHR